MNFDDKELVKSLTSLIDETLQEIEEIKKSKFAASEIKIEGPGDGIAGKPVNGDLHAKKKEEKDEDEEMEEDEDVEKAEDEDEEHEEEECEKAEDEDEEDEEEEREMKKSEQKAKMKEAFRQHDEASKNVGKLSSKDIKMAGQKGPKKSDISAIERESKKDLKKSLEESEELIKAYVDSRFEEIDEKLSKMTSIIESFANAPVARKGVPAGVQPLHKSTDEIATLSKSNVIDRLFELKKSGTYVDSSDMFKLETSKNYNEVLEIANKYGVK